MKWLFKFFLFIGILFATGTSRSASSFHTYSSVNFITLDEALHYQNDLKFTPVQPVRDSRVFQIVEDEEDTTTSRVKRNTALAVLACAIVYGITAIFQTQSKLKVQYQPAYLSLNSLPRYIQLRSIRV
ncbi:hypothetical protein [Mucilaginibacter auburnensis]|uniref:Uncharacterized protein n=1 Tax=Mucilaginibacter auburnensis TaxID=1457233 RepID=A0A2H9VUL9_9SPHI|nr:hypothetical protein [Mucilaginibacter auburnensis]PJJ84516.1 hypothetical protein CLV57_1529 [Mucilaginibacter auburnensis]